MTILRTGPLSWSLDSPAGKHCLVHGLSWHAVACKQTSLLCSYSSSGVLAAKHRMRPVVWLHKPAWVLVELTNWSKQFSSLLNPASNCMHQLLPKPDHTPKSEGKDSIVFEFCNWFYSLSMHQETALKKEKNLIAKCFLSSAKDGADVELSQPSSSSTSD